MPSWCGLLPGCLRRRPSTPRSYWNIAAVYRMGRCSLPWHCQDCGRSSARRSGDTARATSAWAPTACAWCADRSSIPTQSCRAAGSSTSTCCRVRLSAPLTCQRWRPGPPPREQLDNLSFGGADRSAEPSRVGSCTSPSSAIKVLTNQPLSSRADPLQMAGMGLGQFGAIDRASFERNRVVFRHGTSPFQGRRLRPRSAFMQNPVAQAEQIRAIICDDHRPLRLRNSMVRGRRAPPWSEPANGLLHTHHFGDTPQRPER